jgi:hypothetical protein
VPLLTHALVCPSALAAAHSRPPRAGPPRRSPWPRRRGRGPRARGCARGQTARSSPAGGSPAGGRDRHGPSASQPWRGPESPGYWSSALSCSPAPYCARIAAWRGLGSRRRGGHAACVWAGWEPTSSRMGPRVPTVRLLLLFHTGAPLLVVQKGVLKAEEGRTCDNRTARRPRGCREPALEARLQALTQRHPGCETCPLRGAAGRPGAGFGIRAFAPPPAPPAGSARRRGRLGRNPDPGAAPGAPPRHRMRPLLSRAPWRGPWRSWA